MSTVEKQHRLDQALHNEKLCRALQEMRGYPDWVITTAFYSAIHFVRHALFPLRIAHPGSPGKMNTFHSAADYMRSLDHPPASVHKVIKQLVKLYFRAINRDYRRLYDLCQGARYNDYRVLPQSVQLALSSFARIKIHCYNPETGAQERAKS